MTTTLITVLRGGGRYGPAWVERLFAGARRHAPTFDRFLLLTDLDISVDGAEIVLLRHEWPGWWAKMEAFRPDLGSGPTVLCDLDTVFTGPADRLARPTLTVLEDFMHEGRMSSALMRWNGDELSDLYERFAADPAYWMTEGSCGAVPNAVHGDQVVIDHFMRQNGTHPSFFQRAEPGLIDFYRDGRGDAGPVVVFIGPDKPDNASAAMQAVWKGQEMALHS